MNEAQHPLVGAMKIRGWTAADLARHSGLTEAAISRIISRKRRPSATSVAKLSRALNLPLAEMLEPWVDGYDE